MATTFMEVMATEIQAGDRWLRGGLEGYNADGEPDYLPSDLSEVKTVGRERGMVKLTLGGLGCTLIPGGSNEWVERDGVHTS